MASALGHAVTYIEEALNFRLAKQRAVFAVKITCRALALTMIAAGGYLAVTTPQASAAVPISSINSCATAVAAMNAGLTNVSRSRVALKAANRSHNRAAIKKAKTRLAAAEAQRDVVRTKIKTLCASAAVTAQSGGCGPSIDKLAASIELLAAYRAELAALKPSAKKFKSRRSALQSKIRNLETAVNAQTDAMQAACAPPAELPESAPPVEVIPPTPAADTTAPTVTIGVQTPTKDTTPQISLSASEPDVSFTCKLDNLTTPASASFSLPVLTEGTHILRCSGTDAASNAGAVAEKSIVIDLTAPTLPSMGGPLNGAPSSQLNYLVILEQGSGDSAACNVDNGAYAPTNAGTFVVQLPLGTHNVHCIVTDLAGNVSPIRTYGPIVIA